MAAVEQRARLQILQQLRHQPDFVRRDALHDVMRAQLGRVRQPRRLHELLQRVQRVAMEVVDAIGLVRHDERALAHRVLRRDPRRAAVGVAVLRLDAADRYAP